MAWRRRFVCKVISPSLPVLTKANISSSTYILWKSIAHNDQFGPFSSKHRPQKGEEGAIGMAAPKDGTADVGNRTAPAEPYAST